jgi:hypothetical protein
MSHRVSALLLACLLSSISVLAQDFRGQILGTVSDAQGGLLPGASVTVTNLETGVATSVTTDARGQYASPT